MYKSNYTILKIPKFLLKRLLRLEPPYMFSILLAIIVITLRIILLKINDVNFSLTQIFLHVGYLIPFFEDYKWINQVYWTLAIEFQYYFFLLLLQIQKLFFVF
jgi:peptidoglycan/LPS O-acetylase OafA/YrhL